MKKRTTEKLKELLEEHMLASEKEKCIGMIRRLYSISYLPGKPWWQTVIEREVYYLYE